MESLQNIDSLSQLLGRPRAKPYRGALIDAWGVIHNGVELFDGAGEAMVRFREEIGPIVILTNAPRPSSIIPAQLERLGLPDNAYDSIVTSGDAVRAEIKKHLPAPFYRLGPDKDDALYQNLAIDFVPLERADFIICTGMLDELGDEKPEDYASMFAPAIERGVEMICANPDIVVRWGDRLIYCAGALAQVYERLGGKVIHGGKPHKPIYELAMERLKGFDQTLEPGNVLAIGDGLGTDVAGANRHGIDILYIFGSGGIHEKSDASVEEILRGAGAHAVATAESLRW